MSEWHRAPERGSAWLVRLMLWLLRHISPFARLVVLPGITAWFFAFSSTARAASRDYLRAALGRPATSLDVLHHVHSFACAILDRALLAIGQGTAIALSVEGIEHVEAAAASGRGGLLLGAHVGSFAVLRRLADRCPVPVRMLMWQQNDGAYSRVMQSLDQAAAASVIPIGDVQSMLRVHDAVAAGALVGILADRAPAGSRQVLAPFLGRPAPFPAGPFVLAASLGAPVLLFSGIRTGRGCYTIRFTPFADRVTLRREARQADLQDVVTRYAAWLESTCRAHPFNWFNFFPFWKPAEHAPTRARPPVAAAHPIPGKCVLGANLGGAAS